MYSVKLALCIAAGGAIALTITGLLWNIWTTKPELVAVAPKQVAAEAAKTTALPPASANLSAVLPVPPSPFRDDWFVLPPNKGALVLFVPRVASDRIVVVRDEMRRLLDFVEAKSGLPLLRQYRLDPGTYELNLEGFADVVVSVKTGKIATIQLSQNGVSVTNKLPKELQPGEGGLEAYGPDIGPQNISSAEKILYFTAELPGHWQARPDAD